MGTNKNLHVKGSGVTFLWEILFADREKICKNHTNLVPSCACTVIINKLKDFFDKSLTESKIIIHGTR